MNLFKSTRIILSLTLLCVMGLMGCHSHQVIYSKEAPAVIGPYSQAIRSGNLIFCSGQIGLNPESGKLAGEDIESQTTQALKNVQAVLKAAGSDLSKIVKVTLYLTDMKQFTKVNEIYGKFLEPNQPARATVEVSALPKGALIEIDCIATIH